MKSNGTGISALFSKEMKTTPQFNVTTYAARFRCDGFSIFDGILSNVEVEPLRCAVASIPEREEVRRIRQFVTPIFGDFAFATRTLFFDKV